MPTYTPPLRDLDFVLFDVFHAERDWAGIEAFRELDRGFALGLLEEASKVLVQEWLPVNRSGDEAGAQWRDGVVTAPPGFQQAYDAWAQGGWIGLSGDPAHGGQGLPRAMTVGIDEMQYACNSSLNLYFTLTVGASVLLAAHADEATKARWLPRMYTGEWAGVMALTENHAGTDLGLIRTRATPRDDGSYAVTGTKIFITSGEHDLCPNIVHLVLAKLPDAPGGSGGISLFLVPKFLVNDDGSLGARNAVASLGIEHKMGIHGSATNVMQYDGATGWLIGEPHKGLACMFTMMNYERLSVGMQGLGLGEIAFQNARNYALERRQGRADNRAGRSGDADPIIAHGDVRRMLLTARALNEGGRAFAMLVGSYLDLAKYSPDAATRTRAEQRVALFTPVAKAFFTDRGFECAVLAQQVLGGHGYVREWGLEQYVRDARIAQIYEGTNGVQATDLLGRKVVRDGGRTLRDWLAEARADLATVPAEFAPALGAALDALAQVTDRVLAEAKTAPDLTSAVAAEYLDLVGYVTYAWLWARMAAAASARMAAAPEPFLADKLALARFYFDRVLPRVQGLVASIGAGAASTACWDDARI
jgi:alkylation response protein AidB-like acyl-CoA dehydrogenase